MWRRFGVLLICIAVMAGCGSDNNGANGDDNEGPLAGQEPVEQQQDGDGQHNGGQNSGAQNEEGQHNDAPHDGAPNHGAQDEEDADDVPVQAGDDRNGADDGNEAEIDESLSPFVEQYGFQLGEMYPIYARTALWQHPGELGGEQLFTTSYGERYIFQQFEGDYVKVRTADRHGWVSLWYFTDEAGGVTNVEPYEMIIDSPTAFSLYPDEPEPYGFELEAGKVVQIYKEFGDWVCIHALFGEDFYPGDKWIRKSHLIAYDPIFAQEGILKLGSKIYDETGEVKEEDSGFALGITGEKGNMYSFWAPGGRTGYILKEDFEPNPFIEPTLAMTFDVNLELGSHYIVEELTGNLITLRYFDYNNSYGPDADTRTVAFDTMLLRQSGQRLYTLKLWMTYPNSGVELKPTVELINEIETNRQFRTSFGQLLGQPIPNVGHNLVVTADMFRELFTE